MQASLGRFQLGKLLGTGAQSAVYLALDPQLQRDVAIKLMKLQPGASTSAFVNEARAVSRLRHEGIVSVFEAGEQEGRPYLVFEYVEGQTLGQLLKQGPLEPAKAEAMMVAILEALQHAHEAGLVHRDLKPSNILVTRAGAPRITDFGIAIRMSLNAQTPEPLVGTPAYMAPEYIASQSVGPQNDIFAAGLILYEMVFGRRAIQAEGTFQAMHQIANEPLVFPADAARRIDAGLHDIIAKATARDPVLRYASASEMRHALEQHLHPPAHAGADPKAGQSTLEFLLRRMRHKSDFPAMSGAISAINRLATSERSDVHMLSSSILKDFALTNKILRLANSSYYPQFSGQKVSTVSRAIVILGYDAVRSIAVSLLLFEHLRDKKHAEALKEEFLRANFAAILARELGVKSVQGHTEESFICTLFHNLGRLLANFYFPEEAEAIARLIGSEQASESEAAIRVLGISFPDLGMGIARSWGFPDSIVSSMRPLPPGKAPRNADPGERQRALAELCSLASTVVERTTPAERASELGALMTRFSEALEFSPAALNSAVRASASGLVELARVLGLGMAQSRLGQQLNQVAAQETGATVPPAPGTLAATSGPGNGGESVRPETGGAESDANAETVLSAGIQDISLALVEEFELGDLLRIVLETIYRAIPVRRVMLCMRDGRSGVMSARFGLGADIDEAIRHFRFELGGSADLFNLLLTKDVDVLITDAAEPKVAKVLPEWYRSHFSAHSFIALPLRIGQAPVAMIYAENDAPGSVVVTQKELQLMRTLRNQAVLAIKQSRP